MAPGDREWVVAADREASGVTLDPATHAAFEVLAGRYGAQLPVLEMPAQSQVDGT
jgi:LDH2 family malate/lactate/ureidoglycolate dehydrogenase